ncbi:MAG: TIGR03915 family putative DNA repair protein [Tyzzerella sp.]|nr:TIGR03915 family putative DNA repair protein [Tyzzerella sp.]
MRKKYICNDNITGIFSAIYDAWKTRLREEQLGIALKGMVDQELFCEYIEVEESQKKAIAVENLIKRHLGSQAYWCIYHAVLSSERDKGDAILGAMLESRKIPDSRRIMEHLSHPKVQRVFELSRKVSNEAHYYQEIVRFSELQSGILFSEIEPRNQILSCLGDHFANRFPLEDWMIYDKIHRMFLVHEKGKRWILVQDEELDRDAIKWFSATEALYVKLWKCFFESITIKERESYERQRQHLPLRYRTHVVEFQKE